MRNLLLLVFIFSTLFTSAQITIDSTDMPQSGDTLRFSTTALDTALLFNFQKNGTNVTWNFDSLVPIRQGVSEYKASSQTPYSSNVSNRIGEKLADTVAIGGFEFYDVYNFYTLNGSSFSLDYRGATAPTGLSFPFPSTLKITQSYSDKDEVYQFPLDYQDRDSSTFKFVYSNQLLGAYYASSGYRINEVDAWGSLTTPYGTFNCIRVVTDIVGFDTVSFGTNNFGINSHLREYKWLTSQFEIPALTVSGTVANGVFVPTGAQYRDSVRNVPSLFAPFALFVANRTQVSIGDTVEFINLSISILNANYQWDIQPTTFQYVNGTSATTDSIIVVFNDTGFYDVQLVAVNSSGRDTLLIEDYIRVSQFVGINEAEDQSIKFLLYPNPAKKGTIISIENETSNRLESIKIYDLNGKLLNQVEVSQLKNQIQLQAPENKGVYIIQLKTNDGFVNKRLVIE